MHIMLETHIRLPRFRPNIKWRQGFRWTFSDVVNLIILRKKNEQLVRLEIDEFGRAIKSKDCSERRMLYTC